MKMIESSLLISTYNWPQALSACLQSAIQQSVLPGEIIIADDGSGEQTAQLIQSFANQSPVPVKHIWQPDEGFQAARIRNKGFASSAGEYIIQIDGDLILHKDFIKDHLQFKKQGFFTTGSRVLVSEKSTESLLKAPNVDVKELSRGAKNYFNSLRIPMVHNVFARQYKNRGRYIYYVKGCNMAFWRNDILTVNGYNEDFSGWGNEDNEIAIRLINAGINKRFLKFGAVCYHLFHQKVSRASEARNICLMNESANNNVKRAVKGLSQYL